MKEKQKTDAFLNIMTGALLGWSFIIGASIYTACHHQNKERRQEFNSAIQEDTQQDINIPAYNHKIARIDYISRN